MRKCFQIEKPAATATEARVTILDCLDNESAEALYLEMIGLIEANCKNFDFLLNGMRFCDSQTLAAWILCEKAARDRKANLIFHVLRDSAIHKLMISAKLDRTLKIQLV